MNTKTMFSTGKDDWQTPDDLFNQYNHNYNFVLDAAASSINTKCVDYFGPDSPIAVDALKADWIPWLEKGNIWLNPPYSRGLQYKFVEKAWYEVYRLMLLHPHAHGRYHVVLLLPARTDTKLFHEFVWGQMDWVGLEFLKGRVKFKGGKHCAPFPSMVVVF